MMALVETIRRAEGSDKEINAAVTLFVANRLHPDGSGLIFWPNRFPHDPDLPEPTTEEIVDKALTPGKVIRL